MSKSIAVVVALLAGRCLLTASEKEPLTASVKADYRTVRNFVVRAAEKMPADDYAFKPTPEVRSFAQQIAHIADDQYNLCAPAKGETRKAAYTAIEDSLTTKADLITALKDAFAYCDGGVRDVDGCVRVRSGGGEERTDAVRDAQLGCVAHLGALRKHRRLPASERAGSPIQ